VPEKFSCARAEISENIAWRSHPAYNGNPEHHPVPVQPAGLPLIRVYGEFRHHLHYALGRKADDVDCAVSTIDGWPDLGKLAADVPWPDRLRFWKETGILPHEAFL